MLVIGSAAGVAFMGLESISFGWVLVLLHCTCLNMLMTKYARHESAPVPHLLQCPQAGWGAC